MSSLRRRLVAALRVGVLLGACGAGSAAVAAPVNADDFQVRTTGDLVTLCSAAPSDPYYSAAVNFCHGFAVGTYRVLVAHETAKAAMTKPGKAMFCMPSQPPSRNEAIAAFLRWAAAHNEEMSRPPTDGIAEFMAQSFPCP